MGQHDTIMYHDTTIDHLKDILRNGIQIRKPFQREKKPMGVYLSTHQFRWMFWATDRHVFLREKHFESDLKKIPLGVEIKVDVEGLYVVPDGAHGYHEDEPNIEPDKDFICLQDIPRERIIHAYIEKRTDPKRIGGFEEVNCSNCENNIHGAGAPICKNCKLRNWSLDKEWLSG